jgi:hypothetical protein
MRWTHRLRAGRAYRPLMRVRAMDGVRHGPEHAFSEDEIERARLWAARRLRELRTEDEFDRDDDPGA